MRSKILFTIIMLMGSVSFAGVTFDDVKPILSANCVECHAGANKYEVAYGMKEQIYQMFVLKREMPPVHRARVSDADVETVKQWIESGAKK